MSWAGLVVVGLLAGLQAWLTTSWAKRRVEAVQAKLAEAYQAVDEERHRVELYRKDFDQLKAQLAEVRQGKATSACSQVPRLAEGHSADPRFAICLNCSRPLVEHMPIAVNVDDRRHALGEIRAAWKALTVC